MEQKIKQSKDYPEEYITGKVKFFGREFTVTPDVLIPRLETESLVRRAREVQKVGKFDSIIDIGCGSGIIGTSLADLALEIIFLDVSPDALGVAEKNFRVHFPENKAQFIVSDLLEEFLIFHSNNGELERVSSHKSEQTLPSPPFSGREGARILFLANLPYIKGGDWKNMSPDTRFEPELALFGGDETGFEIYERLFGQIQSLLNTSSVIPTKEKSAFNSELEQNHRLSLRGKNSNPICKLIIEFGFDQREIAENVIHSYGWEYEFFADYAGIERFCEIGLT